MADQVLVKNEQVENDNIEVASREHARHIADNYKRLLDLSSPVREERPAPEASETFERAIPMVSKEVGADNAARIQSYRRPAVSGGKLFENVTYKRGGYITGATAAAPEVMMPAAEEIPEATMTPVAEVEDDALPTAATMLHQKEVKAEAMETVQKGVTFWSALSTKMKAALGTVASALVVLLMIVCINTAVLGTINADISSAQDTLTRVQRTYNQLQNGIGELTDPAYVDGWAQGMGMTK